jgi:hypothetical protein
MATMNAAIQFREREREESAGIPWRGTSSDMRRNGMGPRPTANDTYTVNQLGGQK